MCYLIYNNRITFRADPDHYYYVFISHRRAIINQIDL